jgi:hypothetical protein
LYSLSTGKSPFHAFNTLVALTALAVVDPRPVHEINPAIPQPLSDLVSQLLEKRPQDRPDSADEVLQCLEQIEVQLSEEEPTRSIAPRCSSPSARRRAALLPESKKNARWRRLTVSLAIALAVGLGILVSWWVSGISPSVAMNAAPVREQVFISSLDPVDRDNWPFLPPPPPGRPEIQPIGGVFVAGQQSPHGIFMHPPPAWVGTASLTFRLSGAFSTFHSEVCLNDGPPESASPVIFAVYGDGHLLWKSQPVATRADRQECTASVQGVETLRIEVSCTGDPNGAHAVWIEPILAK